MSEPILNPEYWRQRLKNAAELHHAIFRCPLDSWRRIEEQHRQILSHTIAPDDSVLDAGCGWGRLLNLLPEGWTGRYLGIDISPDFVQMARHLHPGWEFIVGDLRSIPFAGFTWAVMISIRPMMKRNLDTAVWDAMERELHRVAGKLLFLEYDESDKGSVE